MKTIIKTPVTVEKVVERVIEETSSIVDADGGPITMLGTNVFVQCTSYAYSGSLTGVNDKFIELSDPKIVYDTGAWSCGMKNFKFSEQLPTKKLTICFTQIESMFTFS